MRYLIDGYNLMHALLGPPAGPQGLEAARQRLLDRLLELPGVEPTDLVVVFDARRAPAGRTTRSYRGVELRFAQDRTADELIEDLVRQDASPATLTVVSDDHRVQNAARRRSCGLLDCLDWVERMKRGRPAVRPPADPEKPERAGDADEWLRAFGSGEPDDRNPAGR